jgi:hypothetical protein
MSGDLPPPDPAHRNRYDAEPASAAPASYDQLRRVLLALGGIAMVIFAIGLGLLVLRDDDDGGGTGAGETFAPVTTATATAGGGGIPSTTGAPATVPAASATSAAPALPTPAPGTAPTALPTPAPGTAPAASTPDPAADAAAGVVATAQALLDAYAEGRWNDARSLNPGRDESDDFLQQAYGPIVDATLIPAAVTPVGDGRYDLRFGLVVHEDQPTGQQTVLMCSYWQVDPEQKTVDRLASARVRVEGGFIDPSSRAGELSTVCARPIG